MTIIGTNFESGQSPIHRLDPRIRIICASLLSIPTALVQSPLQALTALICGIVFMMVARLTISLVAKRLIIVNAFILFLWLLVPITTPGTPAFHIGPIVITAEGLKLSTLITLKSNAIVLILMALLGTIKIQDLGPALQRLRVPNKLCHILLFTYRYIFVIHHEYILMRQAMTARGFKPTTSSHTYKTYAWLVGMLLIKSWDRAERVHNAMKCRGFKGQFYTLSISRTSTRDSLFVIISLIAVSCILAIETFKGILL